MAIIRAMLTDGVTYEGEFSSNSGAKASRNALTKGEYVTFPTWRIRKEIGPQDPFSGPPISINGVYVQIINVGF